MSDAEHARRLRALANAAMILRDAAHDAIGPRFACGQFYSTACAATYAIEGCPRSRPGWPLRARCRGREYVIEALRERA